MVLFQMPFLPKDDVKERPPKHDSVPKLWTPVPHPTGAFQAGRQHCGNGSQGPGTYGGGARATRQPQHRLPGTMGASVTSWQSARKCVESGDRNEPKYSSSTIERAQGIIASPKLPATDTAKGR